MFQIIFNEISAAEISQLPTLSQLELLNEFQVSHDDLENLSEEDNDEAPFGAIDREGKKLYRFRANDLRIYFEVVEGSDAVVVHRVLNRNTFADFLFRATSLSVEDDDLKNSKHFWELIEEGQNARKV